jgi:predicted molibdopterin-dependent oxidoreductase YjgC
VGCQIDLNLDPQTKHIVKVTSKDEYLPNEGNLCVKGRFAFNFVHHPDRLTQPLVRGEDDELHPTTWEHAIETAATGLKKVIDEENYLIQKLARTVGTNSVHSCEST